MLGARPKLRYVHEWDGRTFHYRPIPPQGPANKEDLLNAIPCIGTPVSFPLGDEHGSHFLAHISALVCIGKNRRCTMLATETECHQLRDKVLQRLLDYELRHDWNLDRAVARKGLEMCCPRATDKAVGDDGRVLRFTGTYVVQAVRKFLGCRESRWFWLRDEPVADTRAEGFVIDLRDRSARMIGYD
ncbi:uncharacterized protein LTR77_003922 [Saxophila tyrrhenica]|uniref:Uncharacterized protein n=1 Tax=Saxophila tyrrhenica TaxID=1690608 RepID=A0AAV9PJB5_9PEZI|nr:hypothetical protein LTR77_003922 [Saxophila tyrrhenica]